MVGHPRAPVWILLLNPGFGEKDYYDHVSVSGKMRRCLMANEPENYSNESFDPQGSNPKEKLAKRQELMLSSLRCQTWPAPFYILDKNFKNCEEEDINDGWHWWWKRLRLGENNNTFFLPGFCEKGEEANVVGRCLFALEAFPYHSSSFPQNIVTLWCERQTKYFQFWKNLVQYGLTHEKIIIIRAPDSGRGALGKLLAKAGIDSNGKNVFFFRNFQQVYFTPNNISNRKNASEEIKAAIQMALGQ